jgi:hypothetical protein
MGATRRILGLRVVAGQWPGDDAPGDYIRM